MSLHPYPKAAVARSLEIIREMAEASRAPAILCSWSKDSMVLRDLIRIAGLHWPVITFMTEWHPRKWAFARQMSEAWDVPIITWHPQRTWVFQQGGAELVLGSTYQMGEDPDVPGIDIHVDVLEPPEDATTLPPGYECGMKYLDRTRGSVVWRWDALAIGHRDVDRDKFLGAMPLAHHHVPMPEGHPALWFPLKHWTDREIWDYTNHEPLPVDWRRYSREDNWQDPAWVPASVLNEHNNDCIHACVRCMKLAPDGTAPPVQCPALQQTIDSLATAVPRVDTLAKPYFTPTP